MSQMKSDTGLAARARSARVETPGLPVKLKTVALAEAICLIAHEKFADRFMTTNIKRPGGSETILLVEDDPVVLEMVSEILRQSGYMVLTAASAPQALKTWEKFGRLIDLLLTDVLIPCRSTGLELARKFQQSKPKLKIVFTSGFGPEICAVDPAMASGWV